MMITKKSVTVSAGCIPQLKLCFHWKRSVRCKHQRLGLDVCRLKSLHRMAQQMAWPWCPTTIEMDVIRTTITNDPLKKFIEMEPTKSPQKYFPCGRFYYSRENDPPYWSSFVVPFSGSQGRCDDRWIIWRWAPIHTPTTPVPCSTAMSFTTNLSPTWCTGRLVFSLLRLSKPMKSNFRVLWVTGLLLPTEMSGRGYWIQARVLHAYAPSS